MNATTESSHVRKLRSWYDSALAAAGMRACANRRCVVSFKPASLHQLYCCDRCRYQERESGTPQLVWGSRRRCRAWAAENRNCKTRNPWVLGAPPYTEHLPGAGFYLDIAPLRWPIALRNSRLLHGLMTALTGLPHDDHTPKFTLIPPTDGGQWSVWISDLYVAARLADRQWPAQFADQEVVVSCGPMMQPRAPKVSRRGHQKVRVQCLSPVRIRRDTGEVEYTAPTEGNLLSTLDQWLVRRLDIPMPEDSLRIRILEDRARPATVDMGGKYGVVSGFDGELDLDVNAPARWLLEAAARGLGLGGQTAFGFGRIKVVGL